MRRKSTDLLRNKNNENTRYSLMSTTIVENGPMPCGIDGRNMNEEDDSTKKEDNHSTTSHSPEATVMVTKAKILKEQIDILSIHLNLESSHLD